MLRLPERGKRIFAHRNRIATGFLLLLGLAVALGAANYEVGSLRRMGPGYFPLLLGIALCLLATVILIADRGGAQCDDADSGAVPQRQIRALVFPLSGILLFAGLIKIAGFVPAIVGCTILAGLADRENKPAELLIIAMIVSIFSAVIFVYALGVPVRLFAF